MNRVADRRMFLLRECVAQIERIQASCPPGYADRLSPEWQAAQMRIRDIFLLSGATNLISVPFRERRLTLRKLTELADAYALQATCERAS